MHAANSQFTPKKTNCIQLLATGKSGKEKDRSATEMELTEYGFLIEKLLFIRRLVGPMIVLHASEADSKCNDLRLHHLRALNATLRALKKVLCVITYLPCDGPRFRLEVCQALPYNEKTNVLESIILFCRNQNTVHAIEWASRLVRRISRSTSTEKLLGAADAVDKLTYSKQF